MQSNNRPLLIGITGTYGSGKSTFCHFIEPYYKVIYADLLAFQVLSTEEVKNIILNRWGKEVLKDGKPDKNAISTIVFNNKIEREFLNSVIHPRVLAQMQNIVDTSSENVLCFEIPLLFEAKLENCFDHVVLLTVNPEIRLRRIHCNANLTQGEIQARIDAQLPENIKVKLADTVIPNNGSLHELEDLMQIFLNKIETFSRKSISGFSVK